MLYLEIMAVQCTEVSSDRNGIQKSLKVISSNVVESTPSQSLSQNPKYT